MVQISLQNSGGKVVFSGGFHEPPFGHQRELKYLGHLSVKRVKKYIYIAAGKVFAYTFRSKLVLSIIWFQGGIASFTKNSIWYGEQTICNILSGLI